MKCPKCGYLGFETTDRCRNCQYDFSLAPFSAEPELTLHGADRRVESPDDFELPPIKRQTDTPERAGARSRSPVRRSGAAELAADPTSSAAASSSRQTARRRSSRRPTAIDDARCRRRTGAGDRDDRRPRSEPAASRRRAIDEGALPFDDGPIVPPPAARPPLAVRRSTPEVPRNRPRTTRPVRTESLDFEPSAHDKSGAASQAASDTVASLMETAVARRARRRRADRCRCCSSASTRRCCI